MDKNGLRMIANPYLLKKNSKSDMSVQLNTLNINNFLYLYLEKKYNNIYIAPRVFYGIIHSIDTTINDLMIENVIEELINTIIIKFDTGPEI